MNPTAAITALGYYVPEDRLTNADFEKMVDTSDEWIRTRTGISERRILRDPDKASAFMGAQASMQLLEKRGIDASEIDLIICATATPDMLFPATACLIQDQIGAKNAWGFDLLCACSGFLFALNVGVQFIETGKHQKVLVVGSDTMSRITDYTDRTTCVLFGDAAGAALLEPNSEGLGVLDSVEHVDGSGVPYLHMKAGGSLRPPTHETIDKRWHFVFQEGRQVFKQAVVGMADAAAEIMERNNLTGDDVRFLVPHQANLRIIDATARRMDISPDKVTLNIDRYGNTTTATIPLCLNEWEAQLKRGDNIVLAAFGGGFSWGASYVKWAYDGAEMAEKVDGIARKEVEEVS
ncbi:MAG: beta-ketoacyl-ACP synthase III [Rubricoccaceae bacterium]|nr:beta-ketoacyl-ACP synthase III [Rubricoccaceae bacterium]